MQKKEIFANIQEKERDHDILIKQLSEITIIFKTICASLD